MKIQLHRIHQAPANLSSWQTLMDDLGNPSPEQVARVLGKSPRTIRRYNATGSAPRVVCLAVFWLTRWGRNAVYTQAHNDAVSMAGRGPRAALRARHDPGRGLPPECQVRVAEAGNPATQKRTSRRNRILRAIGRATLKPPLCPCSARCVRQVPTWASKIRRLVCEAGRWR